MQEIVLTLTEIVDLFNALKSVIDDKDLEISPVTKYKMLGCMKNLESYVKNFETVRNDKIRELGQSKEDGEFYIPTEDLEAVANFYASMSDVLIHEEHVLMEPLPSEEILNLDISSDTLLKFYKIMA